MLNIPSEIKQLLHTDSINKNIRIHFPNGERSDICNDQIVKDTVEFTESLSSRNELKFGLCESPIFECAVIGVGNIEGSVIEVFCEIYCNYTVEGSVWQYDLQHYVYQIPYGAFVVDSCKRQSDMIYRKIVAYRHYYIEEVKNNPQFYSFANSSWLGNASIWVPKEVIERFLFDTETVTCDRNANYNHVRHYVWQKESPIREYLDVIDCIWDDSINNNELLSDGTTQFTFNKYYINFEFDFWLYIRQCQDYERQVREVLEDYILSDEAKIRILNYTSPCIITILDNSCSYEHWTNDVFDYEITARDLSDPVYYGCKCQHTKLEQKISVWNSWDLFLKSTTGNVNEYKRVNNFSYLYAPLSGTTIHFSAVNKSTGVYESQNIRFTGMNILNKVKIGVSTYRYYGTSLPYDALKIQRNLTVTKTKYKFTGAQQTKSTVTQTEYRPDGSFMDVDLIDFYSSALELNGLYGRSNRYGLIEKINISQKFILYPSGDLYPNTNLKPEANIGGKLLPENYRTCWYDDYYTKPYGAITCTFTNENFEKIDIKMFINGFTEESSEEQYLTYDINDNYLLKTRDYYKSKIIEILEIIAAKLAYVRYMPVEFTGRGLPYVEAGDTFQILTKSNDIITTIVLNRTIKGEQCLIDSYKSV